MSAERKPVRPIHDLSIGSTLVLLGISVLLVTEPNYTGPALGLGLIALGYKINRSRPMSSPHNE